MVSTRTGRLRFSITDPISLVSRIVQDSASPGSRFIEITHDLYDQPGTNVIRIGHHNPELRPLVEWFATRGWVLYKSEGASSHLIHQDSIPSFWHRVVNGSFRANEEGLIYQLDTSNIVDRATGLVVVFSSMADQFDKAGLARFFEPNFRSLTRHVGEGIAILRIADIDGVVGGFYLPTTWDSKRHVKVNRLIGDVVGDLGVPGSRVTLYGASKGGTASLFHCLFSELRWGCVSVDPVVDDSHHESKYNDSHWTSGGVFPQKKQDLFVDMIRNTRLAESAEAKISIITSPHSPLYSTILRVVRKGLPVADV